MDQGNVFYGLDNRRLVKQPHLIIPYTLNLRIENDQDKQESEGYAEFLQNIPNEFPYFVVTKPKIDYTNNMISLLVGSLMKDMNKKRVDEKILRYIQSYGPMISRVSYNFEIDSFRDNFMPNLCDSCYDLYRNEGRDVFEFPVSIVYQDSSTSSPRQRGFGIKGWDESYIHKKLLPAIANEGLIEISNDRFKVTDMGKRYCNQIGRKIP